MNPLRHPVVHRLLLAGCALLAVLELQRLHAAARDLRQARGDWAARRVTLRELTARLSAPGEGREALLQEEIRALEQDLAVRRTWFAPEDNTPPAPPATSLEAYFLVRAAQDRMRARALAQGMQLPPDEQFGFADHRRAGPPTEAVRTVLRQLAAVERLLELLGDSRAQALLAVRRERPAGLTGGMPVPAQMAADYFVPAAEQLLRPDITAGDAYRIEFTGTTSVLRSFLHQVAGCPSPLFVRSVEAVPSDPDPNPPTPAAGASPPDWEQIVTPAATRFTVTIELVGVTARGSLP